jgi:hypothetical protein
LKIIDNLLRHVGDAAYRGGYVVSIKRSMAEIDVIQGRVMAASTGTVWGRA